MKKPEMSQRQQMNQDLTPEAQMIEEAKRFADTIRNLPREEQIKLMGKNFPRLTISDIYELLER